MYPVLWVDALYEKVRYGSRVVSMAILLVCGMNEEGKREVLAIEPMLEESRESYKQLIEKMKERGLSKPSLIISDAHKGLVAAIGECFPGASWQRCKVHFMRNILVHVPHREKERFASLLKGIWLTSDLETAKQRAQELADLCRTRRPKARRRSNHSTNRQRDMASGEQSCELDLTVPLKWFHFIKLVCIIDIHFKTRL